MNRNIFLATGGVVLILAVVVYFGFMNKSQSPLKTYHNEQNGFEFEYPGDWIFESIGDEDIYIKSKDANYVAEYSGRGVAPSSVKVTGISMRIYFDAKPSQQLSEIKQQQQSLGRKTSDSRMAGQDGFVVQYGVSSPAFDLAYFTIPAGGIVSVMVTMPRNQNIKVFNQIISTFKFTK